MIGREQRFHPAYSLIERAYISIFGVPVVGLRIRARNLLRLLPKGLKPSAVLDAGSGPGVITFLLARRYPEAEVVGVDILESEIDASCAIARRAGIGNVSFQSGRIGELSWIDHFDLIICIDILEHIQDDRAALANLVQCLRPGGTLLLHVPSLYRRYPFARKRINFDVPTHVRPGYEMKQVLAMAREVGLTVLDSGRTFSFLEMLANNVSYLITRAEKRNKAFYALAFPFLNLMALIGGWMPPDLFGAGTWIIAERRIRRRGQSPAMAVEGCGKRCRR